MYTIKIAFKNESSCNVLVYQFIVSCILSHVAVVMIAHVSDN